MSAFDELVASLTVGPALPGALCRGCAPMFDNELDGENRTTKQQRHRAVVQICSACPALDTCHSWSADEPVWKLNGVVGGEIRAPVGNAANAPRGATKGISAKSATARRLT
jgi:hypothetical protein